MTFHSEITITMKQTTHCIQCGEQLTLKQQRVFITKTLHLEKKTGKIQGGPFCGNACRAARRSDIAAMAFNKLNPNRF